MHNNDYRIFDGFYIPVIPDADYHSDTDHRGCNFLFIDDRQKRYVISFESRLDVYEKCVDFPQYKKSEYSENGRTMHTLLMERDAENERGNIRQRQAEGIAATKVRGVKFNRPSAVLPDNFHDVYQRWSVGKLTNAEAAKECGMPVSTFSVLKEKTIWKQEEMRRHWKFGRV